MCTLALARFAGHPVPDALTAELDRIDAAKVYERDVFLVRNQGFVAPAAARRITFEDSLAFERLHEQAYCERGIRLTEVPAGPPADRVAVIRRLADATCSRLIAGRQDT